MIQELQSHVKCLYVERGYDAKVQTLLLGVMEELGELAQAILLTECEDFKPSAKKMPLVWSDARDPSRRIIACEVGDCITYLLALCNRLEVEPYFKWLRDNDPRI